MTHLNDISKVYMEKVAKPDFLDLDKDGNKKEPMKKAAVEAPKERLKTDRDGYRVPKKDADAARERLLAKARAKRAKMSEALDPVGKEDADVDNDGKKNTKSDKYLLNRRKAISKAMKEAKNIHGEIENPSTDLKGNVKKAVKRIDTNVSGDVNKKDKSMGDYGEFVPTPDGKKVTTSFKEGYSNWRNDLREVMGEDGEEKKQVKEKNVKNTIKINPKISEEAIILESVELSEDHEIETLNYAVDFFVEQGINEDGLEMVIEELGLEEFVDLVYEVGYETLSEAYALTSKKKTPKKLPKGTAPAKTTKATISRGDRKIKAASPSGAFKRRPAAAKAVETAKKEQPKKKPVRDAIARGVFGAVKAYKAGMERHKKAMGAAKETGKTIAKAAAVTHEAGRRAGQSKAGKAIKKAGSAALKAGAEKVKKDIESLKVKNRVRKEEYNVEETAMQMSPQEVALQKKKATVDQQIAMKRKQALTKIKKQPEQEVNKEEFELDERTRYAKETGKDYTTGNPSEKGGTMKGSAMAKVGAELRKTGGMMSSRKKAIQPQGKKKEKGAKPKFKTAPTPVDKIKAKLAQKRAPKKDPYGYGQGRYQGD